MADKYVKWVFLFLIVRFLVMGFGILSHFIAGFYSWFLVVGGGGGFVWDWGGF